MINASRCWCSVARCQTWTSQPPFLRASLLLLLSGGVAACAVVDRVDKVSKIPGLEQAQVLEGLDKPAGPNVHDGPASPLRADPSVVDFGDAPVASDNERAVLITSPFAFPVTVLKVSVQGSGFTLSSEATPPQISPHGQLAVVIRFHPTIREQSSGVLLLELDSAGGRFTRVSLRGKGI